MKVGPFPCTPLQRLVRHLEGSFRRVQLSHPAFLFGLLSSIENSGSMKNEQSRSFKLDSQFRPNV